MSIVRQSTRCVALSGVALVALLLPTMASAQQATSRGAGELEEVVVTATRQSDTVNRVALSINAQTQLTLDQKGIKSAGDLQGTVPSLAVSQVRGPGLANISVRGITDFQAGAPTTGFYLDDTSLTKRNAANTTTASGNGAPVPPLFDLERVEVLRGPQGTLYGGSSEGGTVRYITPQPSLTRYSDYARAEVSKTKFGGTNYEGGVAVGGPIINDKLGFRVSAFERHDNGWQDRVDQYGKLVQEDSNKSQYRILRGALTWAPVEDARVTLSVLGSRTQTANNNFNGVTLPVGRITVPQACFNTTTIKAGTNDPNPLGIGAGCQTLAGVNYVRPGFTLAPVAFGRDAVVTRGQAAALAPQKTNLLLPVLTLEYQFPSIAVKSITSYVEDDTKLVNSSNGAAGGNNTVHFAYGSYGDIPNGINYIMDQFPQNVSGNGVFFARNKRYGISQEIRLSSAGDARPFSWVAGLYYSSSKAKASFDETWINLEQFSRQLYGVGVVTRYGIGLLPMENAPGVGVQNRSKQNLKDEEMAAFGEANYWPTQKLKLTAGLRVSRTSFDYLSLESGPRNGLLTPNLNPTTAQPLGSGVSAGSTSESPVTPKLGAQYQITSDDMIYVSAARGFRPGGVGFATPVAANPNLAQFGLLNTDIPTTYRSDSVLSYEAGAKLRLLDRRLQLNLAAYRIDWNDVQVSINPTGNVRSTTNAGRARSEGFEVEADALIMRGWTANLGLGYTNARFLETVIAVPQRTGFLPLVAAYQGQKMEVPPISLSFGSRYELELNPGVRGYIRADYRYTSSLKNIAAQIPQQSSFAPDNIYVSSELVNGRIGITFRDVDVNLFANNLLNYDKGNVVGGRGSCLDGTAACASFRSYNPYFQQQMPTPRQIGIQVAYRH